MTFAITVIATIPCAFAFGYAIGHHVGYTDGVSERDEYTRIIRRRSVK